MKSTFLEKAKVFRKIGGYYWKGNVDQTDNPK